MEWSAPAQAGQDPQAAQLALGLELKSQYSIRGADYMQACSTCHR